MLLRCVSFACFGLLARCAPRALPGCTLAWCLARVVVRFCASLRAGAGPFAPRRAVFAVSRGFVLSPASTGCVALSVSAFSFVCCWVCCVCCWFLGLRFFLFRPSLPFFCFCLPLDAGVWGPLRPGVAAVRPRPPAGARSTRVSRDSRTRFTAPVGRLGGAGSSA